MRGAQTHLELTQPMRFGAVNLPRGQMRAVNPHAHDWERWPRRINTQHRPKGEVKITV